MPNIRLKRCKRCALKRDRGEHNGNGVLQADLQGRGRNRHLHLKKVCQHMKILLPPRRNSLLLVPRTLVHLKSGRKQLSRMSLEKACNVNRRDRRCSPVKSVSAQLGSCNLKDVKCVPKSRNMKPKLRTCLLMHLSLTVPGTEGLIRGLQFLCSQYRIQNQSCLQRGPWSKPSGSIRMGPTLPDSS